MGLQRIVKSVVCCDAGLEHDECLRLDETVGVLMADHRGFKHGVMGDQRALDLERGHPDARHFEHVVGAAAVVVVAVFADAILVPRVGPVAPESAARFLTLPPIAVGGRRPLDDQFADLAVRQDHAVVANDLRLVARHGRARRAVADFSRSIGKEDVQHLGRADAVDDLGADDLLPAVPNFFRQRLAR